MNRIQSIIAISLALLSIAGLSCHAQDAENYDWRKDFSLELLKVETVADYKGILKENSYDKKLSGIGGSILEVSLGGNITGRFHYYLRWRASSLFKERSFFDSIDRAEFSFRNKGVELCLGKQTVALGGWEYDLYPTEIFFVSESTFRFPCYQWGLSASYNFNETRGQDMLILQACTSPFRNYVSERETYAFSLQWRGSHGFYEGINSVNFVEQGPGQFVNFVAIGNRFHIVKQLEFDLDLIHRTKVGSEASFLKDFSVMSCLKWDFAGHCRLYCRTTFDHNSLPKEIQDWNVSSGTSMWQIGGGLEYFPVKDNKDIRLHALCSYCKGIAGNEDNVLKDKMLTINIGATWRVDFMKIINKRRTQEQ